MSKQPLPSSEGPLYLLMLIKVIAPATANPNTSRMARHIDYLPTLLLLPLKQLQGLLLDENVLEPARLPHILIDYLVFLAAEKQMAHSSTLPD